MLRVAVVDEDLTIWFLSHGADPNAGCVLDVTPLSRPVSRASFSVIKLLFDHGGSIEHGQLLHCAAFRNADDRLEVFAYLFNEGAQINNIMYQNGLDYYMMQNLFALGTPLRDAASNGKLDVVMRLVEHGAHPLIKDSIGHIPLESAENKGLYVVAEYLRPITAAASEPTEQFTAGRRTIRGSPVPPESVVT